MLDKLCPGCSIVKPLSDFYLRATGGTRRQAKCKACQGSYTRRHFEANRDLYYASNARSKAKIIEVVREAKNRPCADCGVSYPYYVMDFDHRSDKKFQLGRASSINNFMSVQAEIEKCDVVCANCHRIRTHGTKNAG